MISLGDLKANAVSYGGIDLVGVSVGAVEVWPLGNTIGTVSVETQTQGTGFLQWEFGGPVGAWQSTTDNHYSGTAGATARFRFHGTQVSIQGARDAHHGQVSVSLDGGVAFTVDMYAATRDGLANIYVSPTLANGPHTVQLTVLGTKQTASGGTVVAVDRARVAATEPTVTGVETFIEDSAEGTGQNQVAYAGTWNFTADNHYSSTAGSTMTLRWTGTNAKIYGARDAHHGQASVTVDGGAARTIDAYSATRVAATGAAPLFDTGTLPAAAHTLVVTVSNTKQTASTGTVVPFAHAIVLSTLAPPAVVRRPLTTEDGRTLTTEDARTLTTEG